MRKIIKYFVLILLFLFIAIQFYPRPSKNKGNSTNDISAVHTVPPEVMQILKTSCYDCHSNNTYYPWYNHLQPVSSWMGNHINDGKRELNFSEYATYSIRKKYKKMEEIHEQVKEEQMPLSSYTFIHRDAILSNTGKKILENWALRIHDSIRSAYPADSLVRKK